MLFSNINFLAVLIAALSNVLLGMFWYSPSLLGTLWAKSHNFRRPVLRPTSVQYLLAIGVAFILAWVLAAFINWFGISTIWEAKKLAFFLWLGFIATTQFSGVIWAKKPYISYLIDASFELVSLVIMAVIIATWPW